MKQRCLNPNVKKYKWYGGAGVTVCDRWMSFANFWEDMGPRPSPKHTIERKNRSIGYQKDNCEWATHAVQARNRGNVRLIEFNGERLCAKDWSQKVGIKAGTILHRIHNGWSAAEALTLPLQPGAPKV